MRRAAATPPTRTVSQYATARERPLPVASRAARDEGHIAVQETTLRLIEPAECARLRGQSVDSRRDSTASRELRRSTRKTKGDPERSPLNASYPMAQVYCWLTQTLIDMLSVRLSLHMKLLAPMRDFAWLVRRHEDDILNYFRMADRQRHRRRTEQQSEAGHPQGIRIPDRQELHPESLPLPGRPSSTPYGAHIRVRNRRNLGVREGRRCIRVLIRSAKMEIPA